VPKKITTRRKLDKWETYQRWQATSVGSIPVHRGTPIAADYDADGSARSKSMRGDGRSLRRIDHTRGTHRQH